MVHEGKVKVCNMDRSWLCDALGLKELGTQPSKASDTSSSQTSSSSSTVHAEYEKALEDAELKIRGLFDDSHVLLRDAGDLKQGWRFLGRGLAEDYLLSDDFDLAIDAMAEMVIQGSPDGLSLRWAYQTDMQDLCQHVFSLTAANDKEASWHATTVNEMSNLVSRGVQVAALRHAPEDTTECLVCLDHGKVLCTSGDQWEACMADGPCLTIEYANHTVPVFVADGHARLPGDAIAEFIAWVIHIFHTLPDVIVFEHDAPFPSDVLEYFLGVKYKFYFDVMNPCKHSAFKVDRDIFYAIGVVRSWSPQSLQSPISEVMHAQTIDIDVTGARGNFMFFGSVDGSFNFNTHLRAPMHKYLSECTENDIVDASATVCKKGSVKHCNDAIDLRIEKVWSCHHRRWMLADERMVATGFPVLRSRP